MSVDELNASICLLETDAEMAAWARGLMRGLNAGDNKPGASDPYSEGWHVGRASRQKADELRAQLSENGGGDKEANAPANAPAFGKANAPANAPPIGEPERRTKNEEQGTNNEKPKKAPKVAAPSEAEWVAYCSETWPDWHPQSSADSWAYYESVGWRTRAGALKDWRSAARTAHSNAREWGKLQPTNVRGETCAPTLPEWLAYGQEVATANRTRGGATWPKDLAVSAYHQCAAHGWKGIPDWKAKLSAECLRWVGMQNGMGR